MSMAEVSLMAGEILSGLKQRGRSVPLEQMTDVRCGCGRLMAKRTPMGLELKCPRCKEVIFFEWQSEKKSSGQRSQHPAPKHQTKPKEGV